MVRALRTGIVAALATVGPATPVFAANAAYQSFFRTVCTTATGTLATRCAETTGGLGNLSGDSESSLNPTQGLAHTQPAISVALTRSKESRERAEKLREDEEGNPPAGSDAGGAQVSAGPFSLLVNVHGTWFDREAAGELERGFDGDSRAAELGLDYRWSERAVVGAIVGIERLDYEFDRENAGLNFTPAPAAGDGEVDDLYLTAFATWTLGTGGFIELSGGYERNEGSYRRNAVFQESNRAVPQTDVRVSGEANATVTWLSFNTGVDFNRGPFSIGPFAGVTKTSADLDGYTERDLASSGLQMHFDDTSRDSLLAHAGIRTSHVLSTGAGVLVPQLRVEYQHEFEHDPQLLVGQFELDTSGTVYRMTSAKTDRDSINAGLSVSMVLANGWMPFFDYSVLLANDDLDRQRATLGLRVEF